MTEFLWRWLAALKASKRLHIMKGAVQPDQSPEVFPANAEAKYIQPVRVIDEIKLWGVSVTERGPELDYQEVKKDAHKAESDPGS